MTADTLMTCVCDMKHTHTQREGVKQRPPVAETGNNPAIISHLNGSLRVATGNSVQTNTGQPSEQERVCDARLLLQVK